MSNNQDNMLQLEDQYSKSTGTPNPEIELIRFDKKVKIYIAFCTLLFVLFVSFKLHNSSIAAWNGYMKDGADEKRGIIAGKPVYIKSDEWLVVSPFILSQDKDPDAGWIVFENLMASNFLKAAGINCWNGTNFAPPLEKLHILDPSGAKNHIYNRYGHIMALPLTGAKDSVDFMLDYPDQYTIKVDPCSLRLKEIGIKYLMFGYKPTEAVLTCLTPVKDTLGLYIHT